MLFSIWTDILENGKVFAAWFYKKNNNNNNKNNNNYNNNNNNDNNNDTNDNNDNLFTLEPLPWGSSVSFGSSAL